MPDRVPILIINDRPTELDAYREIFAQDNFRLFLCLSFKDCLSWLYERPYACILCDVENPQTAGMELAQILQSSPKLKRIPLLFTTSQEVSECLDQSCFDGGLYDCLERPVNPQLLKRKMRVLASLFLQRQKIDQQRSLLEAVLANTLEAVAVFDCEGEPQYQNAVWESLRASHPAAGAEEIQRLRQTLVAGKAEAVDLEVGTRSFCLRLRALSGEFAEGKVVATMCDVTAERLEERRLRARQQELEMFAHVASHDLRAPLRHLSAFTEILSTQLGNPSPQVTTTIETIQSATNRLRGLVDCIQQYAEAGQACRSTRQVNLERVARDTWDTVCKPGARLHLEGPLPPVFGSPSRLGQLLQNLFENALKFASPERAPELWVSSSSTREGLTIHVRDNGIGIPVQHRHRIFEVFQRLHSRQDYAGNGIGLSVCQRVMEQHGGSIEVLSDGLTGSTFLLHFPRRVHDCALTGT